MSWSESREANEFRKHFNEISPDKLPRQKEHKLESLLLSEFEKTSSNEKAICGIQPIAFGGSRIHMITALSASAAKVGKVEVSKNKGGEIDIFCTKNKKLTVIEVKDENLSGESLEETMYQAIAYSVFIRELLRSSDEYGRKWFKIWGMDESNLKESITINAVVAMPYVKEETPKFTGKSINIGNDKIDLHYMLIKEDKCKLTFETSL